jgi:Na+-transporting NADH:ubiquinone oxidoreductase subunit NqrD
VTNHTSRPINLLPPAIDDFYAFVVLLLICALLLQACGAGKIFGVTCFPTARTIHFVVFKDILFKYLHSRLKL